MDKPSIILDHVPAGVTLIERPNYQGRFKASAREEIVRFLHFTQRDSLKHCPHCNSVRYRKHTLVGPKSINLKHPEHPIIFPRIPDNRYPKFLWWLCATESYKILSGWYMESHEVCCSNSACPKVMDHQNKFHEVHKRTGYRKFALVRMPVIWIKSKLFPKSFILKQSEDNEED